MSDRGVNVEIASAFPQALRADVLGAISVLPEPFHQCAAPFRAVVNGEVVAIPYRVYYDGPLVKADQLSPLQHKLLSCLLTRHCSGFVREESLARIVTCRDVWVPPFVVRLVGEYIIEILRVIRENCAGLDAALYRGFLRENPEFWAITKQRVVSYWNCYYREQRQADYVGFQIAEYLDSLVGSEGQERGWS
jgi:hypothetical protein